jgi:hypothetical protein
MNVLNFLVVISLMFHIIFIYIKIFFFQRPAVPHAMLSNILQQLYSLEAWQLDLLTEIFPQIVPCYWAQEKQVLDKCGYVVAAYPH